MAKRFFAAALSLLLVLTLAVPAQAAKTQKAPEEPERTLSIFSVKQFLSFAEQCRLDSYSKDLRVELKTDLDLKGQDFAGVPTFSGTFDGNGHTISGLAMMGEGSTKGLFRYLTQTAVVQDLTVKGDVAPEGSRCEVGGIAGSNAGTIRGCGFHGQVSGGDNVGGLVGINTVNGVIEDSWVRGSVHGNHFVGGLAGKNSGVIRGCINRAEINSTAQENTVSLADVTMESLVNSESSRTVTDIGGIAGNSSGVIRQCRNLGIVGYQHMGYNIGGIAGTQNGYIVDCENQAKIQGRKEVGGIVGQLEPAALVEYEEDALQILRRQLTALGGTVSQTASNVQNTGDALYGQVGILHGQIQEAGSALDVLVPDWGDTSFPDADAIQAAKNALSSSISGMGQTLQGMNSTAQSSMGTLSNNLHTLQSQVNAMSATLSNVSDTIGGTVEDVSDKDKPEDLSGKVERCNNSGTVEGDRNVGGIVGAMAMENDLDPEDDWNVLGKASLNFEGHLRAVLLSCSNSGAISGEKSCVGGISGWQALGLAKQCSSSGQVMAEDAEFVGGISGQCTGYLRQCSAKSTISGWRYVGGVAGSAAVVTDCRSISHLTGEEKLGSILGGTEPADEDEENPISSNLYYSVYQDLGGIDGISYDTQAQQADAETFFGQEQLPELFEKATLSFYFADGSKRQIQVPVGQSLKISQLPVIPERAGFSSRWEGLEPQMLKNLYFDQNFHAEYIAHLATLQADQMQGNKPVMLVEGDFTEQAKLHLTPLETQPKLEQGQTLLDAWQMELTQTDNVTKGRLLMPQQEDSFQVLLCGADGQWRQVPCQKDGSYLVFDLIGTDTAVALVKNNQGLWLYLIVGLGAVLVLAGVALIVRKRRKKK